MKSKGWLSTEKIFKNAKYKDWMSIKTYLLDFMD